MPPVVCVKVIVEPEADDDYYGILNALPLDKSLSSILRPGAPPGCALGQRDGCAHEVPLPPCSSKALPTASRR